MSKQAGQRVLRAPLVSLKAIAQRADEHKRVLRLRNLSQEQQGQVDELARDYGTLNALKAQLDGLLADRNRIQAGLLKRKSEGQLSRGGYLAKVSEQGTTFKQPIAVLQDRVRRLSASLNDIALALPNDIDPAAPIGPESNAIVVRTHGNDSVQHISDRDHVQLAEQLGWTDFQASALSSGSSWPVLLREGALLELALTNYAFSYLTQRGFIPTITPDVVKARVADRCGFAPRDSGGAQQTYFLASSSSSSEQDGKGKKEDDDGGLCLAGTAEIPLVALSASQIFPAESLPLRYVALGHAFRAEAGARGAATRGLYRVHQFSKVEMVLVTMQEASSAALEELVQLQEGLLRPLGIPLRVLDMPTEELGATAVRKFDIEAWMPGRGQWGELSSASNCTDYQARRLGIEYRTTSSSAPATAQRRERPPLEYLDIPTPAAFEATALYPDLVPATGGESQKLFAHTLNATAAAIPRLIVALLENGAVLEESKVEGTATSRAGPSAEPPRPEQKKKGGKATKEQQARKVLRVRLPEVLRRFWVGKEDRIEWVTEGEMLLLPHRQHAQDTAGVD